MAAAEPLPSPEEVLVALSAMLGMHSLKEEDISQLQQNCALDWSSIPWEPCCATNGGCKHDDDSEQQDEDHDVDFSSFPSLSMVREQFDATVGNRQDVEAHVSNLLSRPILVSNATSSCETLLEGADDVTNELGEFIVSKVSEVPTLMLQNFFNSFTTLMNSRLRAYASFLARHGLSLLENSPTGAAAAADKVDEGIVGVEQKLETMLEIGRRVSTNSVATSFRANKEQAKSIVDETGTLQLSMPLVMDASIDISLPRPSGGHHELVTVSFRANGNITGVFAKSTKGTTQLRAVQVDLDMKELLRSMIAEASSVISSIVDMTIAIYSNSLLAGFDELKDLKDAPRSPVPEDSSRKRKAAVVEPDPSPVVQMPTWEAMDESSSSLSPENLVDYILHETDDSVLSPPSQKKKAKVVSHKLPAVPEVTQ
ncbi:expressed unknown protein [Seminavis robusta]|uniref:Uncharacterized protein n=1 Tax=Seminavis robusta TaxID=568900 RepID=A0A9N8H672_9STRA|nr:expressed unknown protein [Seminavis robusta]|eukprot:Sro163_g073120.1 n/a (426) ;mRNA; r:29487-30847